MRILLLNPNTSESITERLTAAARKAAAPGTVIVPLTAPRGVPYIATRAEAQIGGAIALECSLNIIATSTRPLLRRSAIPGCSARGSCSICL